MSRVFRCLAASAVLLAASAVHAGVTFSNVTINGSLVTGATFASGSNAIDFFFPDASVGDPNDPRRSGNILLTFEATSDNQQQMDQDRLSLFILGALAGSGKIFVNEVVEDLTNPGILATHNAVLDSNSQLPYVAVLNFDHPSSHIKVKKTFFLSALDTRDFDQAAIGIIEQTIRVPEPATLTLLALGGLAAVRRRR